MFPARRIITSGGDVFRDEYSLAFDGSDDFLACGSDSTLDDWWDGGGTFASWVNPGSDGESDLGRIFDKSEYIGTSTESSGTVKLSYQIKWSGDDWYGKTAVTFPLNAWTHIAMTYNDDAFDNAPVFYLNGVSVSFSINGQPSDGDSYTSNENSNLLLGTNGNTDRSYDGKMSDAVIYDKILTASEIATIYNGREPFNHMDWVNSSNVISWWRMGDGTERGSGTTIYDMGNNTNNGTMTNMAADDFEGDTP
jgi:hypothetical protein